MTDISQDVDSNEMAELDSMSYPCFSRGSKSKLAVMAIGECYFHVVSGFVTRYHQSSTCTLRDDPSSVDNTPGICGTVPADAQTDTDTLQT